MDRTWVIIALMLIGGASPVFARLGESLQQCISRYGPAGKISETFSTSTRIPDGTAADVVLMLAGATDPNAIPVTNLAIYQFQKNGINITICFVKDKAMFETFTVYNNAGSPPSQAQTEALLAADSAGLAWTADPQNGDSTKYKRDDGATAFLSGPYHGNSLTIIAPGWAAFMKDAVEKGKQSHAESQKKQLEGF